VRPLVQSPAQRWVPTGVTGTVIMVIGAEIISIIGATVVAGSVLQVEDHIRYRIDIAADV
jgi:xanthine/uracil permease